MENNASTTNNPGNDAKRVLCDVLSLSDAKKIAISEGKMIRHKYFMPHEYLIFKKGKWFTGEGFEVPFHYWVGMVPEMLTGWSEHIA